MRATLCFPVAWAATLLAACAQPTPEQQVLNDAVAAVGGRSRVTAARTVSLDGEGTHFNLGQDMRPDLASQTFAVTGYQRRITVAAPRMQTALTRTPGFAYFQGPAPQRQVTGVDGEVAYAVGADGAATRAGAAAARDRRTEFFHHPLTLLRAALDPGASSANARTGPGERLVDLSVAGGLALTLAIDATTRLPTRITSNADHPNLGDIVLTTAFADYQDVSGLRLPAKITSKTDDFTTAEVRLTRQTLDGESADVAAPATATAAPVPTPPAINVTADLVAPGIWFMAGQSHHSALVEQSDHLVLVEAPLSEARTLAVIARARTLVPGKPLTTLVTTHHHFDHTAGLRAAIAEGLTVVTQSGNKAFVEAMAARPHTIQPDALAKSPKAVTVTTVDEELKMDDTSRPVTILHVAGSPHSDTMLMVYAPKEQVLIEADVYSPASQAQPYAANLLENITKRGLKVGRILPLHGAVVPFGDLVKAAK